MHQSLLVDIEGAELMLPIDQADVAFAAARPVQALILGLDLELTGSPQDVLTVHCQHHGTGAHALKLDSGSRVISQMNSATLQLVEPCRLAAKIEDNSSKVRL